MDKAISEHYPRKLSVFFHSIEGRLLRRKTLRRLTQVGALLLFLYLAVISARPETSILPVDLFFRLDPLIGLSASLAAREIAPYLLWSLPIVLLALAFKRTFCGWLCPLGTTLELFSPEATVKTRSFDSLRSLPLILLLLVVVSSLFGSLALIWLDPLTLFLRAIGGSLLPALNLGLTSALTTLYQAGILPDQMVAIDEAIRPALLPLEIPSYRLGAMLGGLLLGLIILNLAAPRFWCRYLCPLGAMLGLIGRLSPLRKVAGSDCTGCGRCVSGCQMAATPTRAATARAKIGPGTRIGVSDDCVFCLDCLEACPKGALKINLGVPEARYNPSRRKFLAGIGVGAIAVAAARVDGTASGADEHVIRPPGAKADFLARCARCGQCVKACPTGALQPAGFESGIEGLFSPVVVARFGACDWSCNLCGQVCPTGAIEPLSLEAKRQTQIGQAYIDHDRCIPWADGQDCIVCEEMCPTPEKAIVLDSVEFIQGGQSRTLLRPRVERERCVGCGLCEKRCPLPRQAGIRVFARAADPRERQV